MNVLATFAPKAHEDAFNEAIIALKKHVDSADYSGPQGFRALMRNQEVWRYATAERLFNLYWQGDEVTQELIRKIRQNEPIEVTWGWNWLEMPYLPFDEDHLLRNVELPGQQADIRPSGARVENATQQGSEMPPTVLHRSSYATLDETQSK